MITPSTTRRSLLRAVAAAPLALAGCGTPQGSFDPGGAVLAEVPPYRVGDRWSYSIDSLFRAVPNADETVEVTGIGADGIGVRVTTHGGGAPDVIRTERWSAPGRVVQGAMMDVETRRFVEPLERYRFPLADGQRWNQWVDQVNETGGTKGSVNRYVVVRGMAKVTVRAGTFDAVRMNVLMRLDDETAFRHATECNYQVWYAPAVRGVVREERRAEYREKSDPRDSPRMLSQNEVVELIAFAPGR